MRVLVGLVVALFGSWLVLVVALLAARPDGSTMADAARILPDTVAMLRRLVRDPAVPRSARVTVWLLLGYLISPIDLIPDFIPVIGYADDAIVAAMALRRIVRTAGPDAITRHWTGSSTGLAVVHRLAGMPRT